MIVPNNTDIETDEVTPSSSGTITEQQQQQESTSIDLVIDPADELAEIFQNCTVYFHEFKDADNLKKLSRYVIAYDGDVDKTVTSSTTHVVVENGHGLAASDDDDVRQGRDAIPVVDERWILSCVEKGRLVDTEEYERS